MPHATRKGLACISLSDEFVFVDGRPRLVILRKHATYMKEEDVFEDASVA